MNIYVVSNGWRDQGSDVIGAAVDRAGTEKIADRYEESAMAGWSPWTELVDAAEGACTWTRNALWHDGTVHPSLFQEIVVVPLAGYGERPTIDPGPASWARQDGDHLENLRRAAEVLGLQGGRPVS